MSNPPVPPSNPDDSRSPEQPEYGKSENGQTGQPQYGQETPQYGQPQFGQQAPQYGQQAPQQAPQYGQPQYGQQAPQYGQQAPQYGQPQYGQGGWPSQQAGWPSQQASTTSDVPPLVNTAFLMILAAGILNFISSIVLATSGADSFYALLEQSAAQQGQELPPGTFEGMQGGLLIGAIVGGLITLGLYALVAFPVRKGKNWARILGTVFAAISLLGLLGGAFMFGALYGTIQLITILLGVAAIVLLYLPGASPYFQKNQPFANPYSQPGNPYGR
ncbi:hypothetical protein [Arthrobacter sp. ISL-30]|uniref:hypothetical protein n=1 Tax=Arthrobacter sp. ISL-30 TaxID=2819109 RepID=UPI001BEB6907|nr:hypothetical protein [Arthrobacter sp. ISL-30]MBT2514553.1 hypothetical protein [Arthrobacter sp. ISL-30]